MSNYIISIIIPSKNNGKTIGLTLKSIIMALNILKKYEPGIESEIIVVDAHSTDETLQILENYVKIGLIKVVYDKGEGPAPARNLGLKHAKGDIIFFIDADCVIEPLHFIKFLKAFKSGNRVAVVWTPGIFFKIPKSKKWKIARLALQHEYMDHINDHRAIEDTIYGASAMMAVKRDIAVKVGGFWKLPYACEDNDFTYRIWRMGHRVVRVLTRSISLPRMTMRELWRQQLWYGSGVICFYMKHRYDPIFWKTRGSSLYMLFRLFGLTLAIAWVVLRALFSPVRALRLWLLKILSLEAGLLLVFKRLANLIGMLKGIKECKS